MNYSGGLYANHVLERPPSRIGGGALVEGKKLG